MKWVLLRDTRYARSTFEIAVNGVRAVVLIPIDSWSLWTQWATPPSLLSASSAASALDVLADVPPPVGARKHTLSFLMLLGRPTDVGELKEVAAGREVDVDGGEVDSPSQSDESSDWG